MTTEQWLDRMLAALHRRGFTGRKETVRALLDIAEAIVNESAHPDKAAFLTRVEEIWAAQA